MRSAHDRRELRAGDFPFRLFFWRGERDFEPTGPLSAAVDFRPFCRRRRGDRDRDDSSSLEDGGDQRLRLLPERFGLERRWLWRSLFPSGAGFEASPSRPVEVSASEALELALRRASFSLRVFTSRSSELKRSSKFFRSDVGSLLDSALSSITASQRLHQENIVRCRRLIAFELRKRPRLQGNVVFLYLHVMSHTPGCESHYVIATNLSCLSRKTGHTPLIWRPSLPKYNYQLTHSEADSGRQKGRRCSTLWACARNINTCTKKREVRCSGQCEARRIQAKRAGGSVLNTCEIRLELSTFPDYGRGLFKWGAIVGIGGY